MLLNLSVDSVESAAADDSLFVIVMPRVLVNDYQVNDTLPVMLESGGMLVGGFDIKLAYDSRLLSVLEILPGEMYDSCGWEFFNAKSSNLDGREGSPSTVWQAVAIADMLPDEKKPLCFSFDRPVSIIKLVVSNEFLQLPPDTIVPFYFFWEDCTDNTLSGVDGNTLYLSTQVLDYYSGDKQFEGNSFPSVTGAPRSCINQGARNKPIRKIAFHNGGVEFKAAPILDSIKSQK